MMYRGLTVLSLCGAFVANAYADCPPIPHGVGLKIWAVANGDQSGEVSARGNVRATGWFHDVSQPFTYIRNGEECSVTLVGSSVTRFGSVYSSDNSQFCLEVRDEPQLGFVSAQCAGFPWQEFSGQNNSWEYHAIAQARNVLNGGWCMILDMKVGHTANNLECLDGGCIFIPHSGSAFVDAGASVEFVAGVSISSWDIHVQPYALLPGDTDPMTAKYYFKYDLANNTSTNAGWIGGKFNWGGAGRGDPEMVIPINFAGTSISGQAYAFTDDQFDFDQDGRFNQADVDLLETWLNTTPGGLPAACTGWDAFDRNLVVGQGDIDLAQELVDRHLDSGFLGDGNFDGVLNCADDAPLIAAIADDTDFHDASYVATADVDNDGVITAAERRLVLRMVAPADVCGVGGAAVPPDGQYTADDLIEFVNAYGDGTGCPGAAPCDLADITDVGGGGVWDGQLTIDDLLLFINATSDGCY